MASLLGRKERYEDPYSITKVPNFASYVYAADVPELQTRTSTVLSLAWGTCDHQK